MILYLWKRKRPSTEKEEEAKTSSQKFILSHCKCRNVLHGMKIKSLIIYHPIYLLLGSIAETCLIQTPRYYRQFALSLGKPFLFFSKFNPLNMDTLLIVQTLPMAPSSVHILTGFACIMFTLDILRAFKFWLSIYSVE